MNPLRQASWHSLVRNTLLCICTTLPWASKEQKNNISKEYATQIVTCHLVSMKHCLRPITKIKARLLT